MTSQDSSTVAPALGALAGAVLTAVHGESGNLVMNMAVLALPGALVGAIAGAVW
jgi:hypothetical protein